ncbi:hypothetical protein, partial [Microbulbifer agarilyticus]
TANATHFLCYSLRSNINTKSAPRWLRLRWALCFRKDLKYASNNIYLSIDGNGWCKRPHGFSASRHVL